MHYKANITRIENNSAFVDFENDQGHIYRRIVPIPYGSKFDNNNLNSLLEDARFKELLTQIDQGTHHKVLVGAVEFEPKIGIDAAPPNEAIEKP